MQEILFRGKDRTGILNNQWLYGSLDNTDKENPQIIYTDRFGNKCFVIVTPETVGQYTGLTDSNGKRIFEGDIVKCFDISRYKENEFISNVVFLDGSWLLHESEDCDVYLYNYENEGVGRLFEIQVIGNIHDNPELLTK